MPQVPYSPVPTEKPNEAGIRGLSVSTPGEAFGAGIGQAIGHLGKVEEHVGDELFKRALALQELQNETEAKTADANYAIEVGKLHANFNSLQGVNAGPQALEKHSRDIQALREEFRGSLSNPMVKKMFDGPSYQLMSRTIFNAAGHAASQVKQAANNASLARIDALRQEIFNNSRDDVAFERLNRQIAGEIRSQAALHGWDEATVKNEMLKAESTAWMQRIVGMAKDNPFEARTLFDENKGRLRFADYERTENAVLGQTRTTAARIISGTVNADLRESPVEGMKEKTLEERIKEGETEAKRLGLRDEDLDGVRDRIIGDYSRYKRVVHDDFIRTKTTLDGAAGGFVGGKKPTNVDELRAISPEVEAAWDKMVREKPSEARRIEGVLARNSKDDYPDTPEARDRYFELLGLRQTDPAAFMDVDLTNEKLPFGRRAELFKMQQAALKNADADPRVTRAYGILSRAFNFEDMGITKAKDPSKNAMFMGALQVALGDWRDSHGGKPPTDVEVKEIGTRLLQEMYSPGAVFGDYWRTTEKLYEMKAPSAFAETYRALPRNVGRTVPDEEIRQAFLRLQLKKLETPDAPVKIEAPLSERVSGALRDAKAGRAPPPAPPSPPKPLGKLEDTGPFKSMREADRLRREKAE